MKLERKRNGLVEYMKTMQVLKTHEIEKAFLSVKRENFVPGENKAQSYIDRPLPIGYFQTISQPSTISIMLEMLGLEKGMKVLEVGSGSGYVLALLSKIVGSKGKVIGIEKVEELAMQSEKNLKKEKIKNIKIVVADGSKGLESEKPFDRILVSAGCPFFPKPLVDQLGKEGIIVAPVGDRFVQQMSKLKKFNGKKLKETYLESIFAFVPLRGEFGWKKN